MSNDCIHFCVRWKKAALKNGYAEIKIEFKEKFPAIFFPL